MSAITKDELLRRHKAERKDLRKECNALLQGKKGDKRAALEEMNEKKREELSAKHAEELASLEANIPELTEEEQAKARAEKTRIKREKKRAAALENAAKKAQEKAEAGPTLKDIESQTIETKLGALGLKMKEISADGNCLYRAIADQLQQNKSSSFGSVGGADRYRMLRGMCAQYMSQHPAMFEPFLGEEDGDLVEYCDRIKNTNEWGGQLELRALAGALSTPIKVISAGEPVLMGENFSGEPIIVTFHKHYLTLGEHYNSVQSK